MGRVEGEVVSCSLIYGGPVWVVWRVRLCRM